MVDAEKDNNRPTMDVPTKVREVRMRVVSDKVQRSFMTFINMASSMPVTKSPSLGFQCKLDECQVATMSSDKIVAALDISGMAFRTWWFQHLYSLRSFLCRS